MSPRIHQLVLRFAALPVVLALIGSACNSVPAETASPSVPATTQELGTDNSTVSTSSTDSETTGDDSAPTFLDLPSNPLPVKIDLEYGAADSVEIGPDGGAIEATGADGVTYSLTIPPGALFGNETITMTPVKMSSPSVGGTFSGVSLEPDGLVLFEPALLEAQYPDAATAERVAFGADHDGTGFHLKPSQTPDETLVTVSHFSMDGFWEATAAEIEEAQQLYRADPSQQQEAYIVSSLMAIISLVDDDEERGKAIGNLFETWFRQIKFSAPMAQTPSDVSHLIGEFLSAVDQSEYWDGIYGLPMPDSVALESLRAGDAIQDAIDRMFKEANLRCIQERDIDFVFEMLRWGTIHTWLFEQGLATQTREADHVRAVDQCMRFEVVFTSSVTGHADDAFVGKVEGMVDLSISGAASGVNLTNRSFVLPAAVGTLTGTGHIGDVACYAQDVLFDVILDLDLVYTAGTGWSNASVNHHNLKMTFEKQPNWTCGEGSVYNALWFPWFWDLRSDSVTVPTDSEGLEDVVFDFPLDDADLTLKDSESHAFKSGTVEVEVVVSLVHTPQLP